MNIKKLIIALFLSALLIAGVLVAGGTYYKTHFVPGTIVNKQDVSNMKLYDAFSMLGGVSDEYVLKITTKTGDSEYLKASDIDLASSLEEELTGVLKKNSFWVVSFFEDNKIYDLDENISYNESLLNSCVKKFDFYENQSVEPVSATIEKEASGYVIKEEQLGDIIIEEKVIEKIKECIATGKTELNLVDEKCYKMPPVMKDSPELQNSLSNIKAVENVVIKYDFKDRTEVLDKNVFLNWIKINDSGELDLDEAKIKTYVEQLAYKYDTYKKDRQFKSTLKGEVTVGGGIYGWEIYVDEEVKKIQENILSGASCTREPVYYISGYERASDDIGSTYIEIDIEAQHLWFYKNNELLLESDIVSGLPNSERSTPKGVFCVWSREKGKTLTGPGYSSFVDYWMPINWEGVGLHDAPWQSNFGGEIYKSFGSHGCINLPFNTAKNIYENVEVGTPVVIV